MQLGVDPKALRAGCQQTLSPMRLAVQKQLLLTGMARHTPIMVTREGVVVDGHHAVRAAAEMQRRVAVLVVGLEVQAGESVADLPLRGR